MQRSTCSSMLQCNIAPPHPMRAGWPLARAHQLPRPEALLWQVSARYHLMLCKLGLCGGLQWGCCTAMADNCLGPCSAPPPGRRHVHVQPESRASLQRDALHQKKMLAALLALVRCLVLTPPPPPPCTQVCHCGARGASI